MRLRPAGLICIAIGLFMPLSCRRDLYRKNISGIKADIEIKRLEKDLFEADPSSIPSLVPELRNKYGSFLQVFSSVIHTGNVNDTDFSTRLLGFCTDKQNNDVYSEVIKAYPDIKPVEKNLEEAFRHYLWHFPDAHLPAVFTTVTGFNASIITITGDSVLGIGLDRYLGRDCNYYRQLGIYNYLSSRMNSWNIVPDCIYALGATGWDFKSIGYPDDNVLTQMIHEGKLKFFEKCMLPEVSDTVIFGFTAGQMKFCRNNEDQMWNYLVRNDLLFKTDQFTIRKLTGEAPFTSYFTNESPGRASVWLGFRIVESFMGINRNVSLAELMKNSNVQDILTRARYRPK